MSVASGLGAFNRDKVANKFGIQLKGKDSNQSSSRPATPATTKKFSTTNTSNVSKNQTIGDFRRNINTNGTNIQPSPMSSPLMVKKSETKVKSIENSSSLSTTKSSSGLKNSSNNNERSNASKSSIDHSIHLNSSIQTNHQSIPKSPTTRKKSIESPINQSMNNSKKSSNETVSHNDRTNSNGLNANTKTNAEIEHQKDQPLYKRQSSKNLDNLSSTNNKNKHQHESATSMKR